MILDPKELLEMMTRSVNRRKRVDRRALESVLRGYLGSGAVQMLKYCREVQYTLTCQQNLAVRRSYWREHFQW